MDNPGAPADELGDRRPAALGGLRVLPDELVCAILEYLTPPDLARLSCVSSVMYILCNEEPLWMNQCLRNLNGPIQYKGSWKKTTLHLLEHVVGETDELGGKQLRFDGFNSWFLHKRLYRCYTTLAGFDFDKGNVDRKENPSLEEFYSDYDGKKPILLNGLADTWPAKHTWTTDQLLMSYGDTSFKISQRSSSKTSMKFKDYVSYMKLQHDEDPLYIFDDKFGEVAPGLLKDYNVPHLFEEDFFDILDRDQRPPYRWLIIGPERSGASWHVDPGLTSAWNTLLCGRKRWALYHPGRVPLGVTVHVNEEDGDVVIDTPTSLQWWLDFYPLLADEDKPIECTQLPGETIYVPSGWWHCVLNLETTIAVTQNFVNSRNFEFVCLDMAPGYRHKGVCRAGLLAVDDDGFDNVKNNISLDNDDVACSNLLMEEKRCRTIEPGEDPTYRKMDHVVSKNYKLWKNGFTYDIDFLITFLDKERDHYNSPWSSGNCMGQREMREWLYRLWVGKPGMRELIWKGACIALDAGRWAECMTEICAFHNLPPPTEFERLPVGTGSNPVYLLPNCVVKIFVEEGLEASLYGLGSELEFHSLLSKVNSPLQNYIPEVLSSGILYLENGSYKIVPWDGSGVPEVISKCDFLLEKREVGSFPFGIWSKQQHDYRKAGMSTTSVNFIGGTRIWPFMITKRCEGKIFAQLRNKLDWEEELNLASFLGEQLRHLHLLPLPSRNSNFSDIESAVDFNHTNGFVESAFDKSNMPAEWDIFVKTLNRKKKDVSSRLTKWGDPIPSFLIEKVDEYIPDNFTELLYAFEDENDRGKVCKSLSWIHSDIMDDNIHMEQCGDKNSRLSEAVKEANSQCNSSMNGCDDTSIEKSWRPSHLLDFSNLSIGDPIYDLIPIYLDVCRGDPRLLKQLLESYKLPLVKSLYQPKSAEGGDKYGRLSYHAMCYCIVHEDNILGAIFSIWNELKAAKSWEEVEQTVWGDLNNYKGFL
ncbi:lysine-specific demethylase JMJ21-like [Humulus lupulus]|uniref:lysine-specific demethylase JMJ21-like n=1 Tax=Humulus lupulus TaxID=3486 RepID=UPI002B40AE0B|nr:lysine-specific demethylase JMJ21-like [Humulus lupulus]